MNDARLELLRKYVDEEPEDPFNWYALAIEEQKHNTLKAEEIYQHLLRSFPDYIPTYYQAGLLYIESGNPRDALKILNTGLLKCVEQKNSKTKNEIQSLMLQIEDYI